MASWLTAHQGEERAMPEVRRVPLREGVVEGNGPSRMFRTAGLDEERFRRAWFADFRARWRRDLRAARLTGPLAQFSAGDNN